MGRTKIHVDEGKFTLRLEAAHKEAADAAAKEQKRSLNFWVAEAVEARLKLEGRLPPPPKDKRGAKP